MGARLLSGIVEGVGGPAAARYTEIDIGWTFIVRKYWGGATNREVKRLMFDHAFTFVDTVIFWVGDTNWRSQGAMTKIGGGIFFATGLDDPNQLEIIREIQFFAHPILSPDRTSGRRSGREIIKLILPVGQFGR